MQMYQIIPGRLVPVIRKNYRPDGSIEEHSMTMRWMDYVKLPRTFAEAGDEGYWYEEPVRPVKPPPPPPPRFWISRIKYRAAAARMMHSIKGVASNPWAQTLGGGFILWALTKWIESRL
jgi:hypothetical protein